MRDSPVISACWRADTLWEKNRIQDSNPASACAFESEYAADYIIQTANSKYQSSSFVVAVGNGLLKWPTMSPHYSVVSTIADSLQNMFLCCTIINECNHTEHYNFDDVYNPCWRCWPLKHSVLYRTTFKQLMKYIRPTNHVINPPSVGDVCTIRVATKAIKTMANDDILAWSGVVQTAATVCSWKSAQLEKRQQINIKQSNNWRLLVRIRGTCILLHRHASDHRYTKR